MSGDHHGRTVAQDGRQDAVLIAKANVLAPVGQVQSPLRPRDFADHQQQMMPHCFGELPCETARRHLEKSGSDFVQWLRDESPADLKPPKRVPDTSNLPCPLGVFE